MDTKSIIGVVILTIFVIFGGALILAAASDGPKIKVLTNLTSTEEKLASDWCASIKGTNFRLSNINRWGDVSNRLRVNCFRPYEYMDGEKRVGQIFVDELITIRKVK